VPEAPRGSASEVFVEALRLGLTSFGGPIAHLAIFRERYVRQLGWLDERTYANLVALGQILPGPTSSQVGMAIGFGRARLPGAIAAWIGFTLPSAVLLVLFGLLAPGSGIERTGLVGGLKLVAVPVVAVALVAMGRRLTPDPPRLLIAAASAVAVMMIPLPAVQVLAIALGGAVGLVALRPLARRDAAPDPGAIPRAPSRRLALGALVVLVVLPVTVGVLAFLGGGALAEVAWANLRAGALVFGGGHVVLPLLETSLVGPGLISRDAFLAGYGVAQGVPGPLFTFAGYVGAVAAPDPQPLLGAAVALGAIFAPGLLLFLAVLPAWDRVRRSGRARAAVIGVEAAVVGILLAALITPVGTSALHGPVDVIVAAAAAVALASGRVGPLAVVVALGALGVLGVVGGA